MSDVAIASCLGAIALLSVLLTVIVVRRVDERRPRAAEPPASYIPFPADLRRSTLKTVAPGVGVAFMFGLIAFRRVWAAAALALISFVAGSFAPRWLWRQAQSRR